MSSWTHAICDYCWFLREGNRTPVRLKGDKDRGVKCCWCGTTSDIWVREDPDKVPCTVEH